MLVLAKVSACHLAPANASGEVTKRSEVGMTSSDKGETKGETDILNRQLHVPHAECSTTAFGEVVSCQHHVSITTSAFLLMFSCDPATDHLILL